MEDPSGASGAPEPEAAAGVGDRRERSVSPERVARKRAAAMVSLRLERKPDMRKLRLFGDNHQKGTGGVGRERNLLKGWGRL
jgi:hypothetical protein